MKITITRCDRCGSDIVDGYAGYISMNWRDRYIGDLTGDNPYEQKDFCRMCMEEIASCIDRAPVIKAEEPESACIPEFFEEGPEPDPEPVEEVEEPKPRKNSKKQLDIGKIKALREAKWSLQDIASEMGCCAQTIANALNREEEKHE